MFPALLTPYLDLVALVACGSTFLALAASLFIIRWRLPDSPLRNTSLLSAGTSFLAAVLAAVVFLVDIILVTVVWHRMTGMFHDDLSLSRGECHECYSL